MPIHDEDVVAVKEATDIIAVVSEYVQLKRVGRSWKGLCPFHAEKSPSFNVNPEGFFHCFGCQKGGDAITFVQELEGLDFAAAVERLANKAGITVRFTQPGEGESRQKRDRLTDALEQAVEFYHERLLSSPDAAGARAYLRSRGYDGAQVRAFKMGWAPAGWDTLCKALKLDRTHGEQTLGEQTGLARLNRAGRLYDFFRSRVMFPIYDVAGRPVGFGGRVLPGAEDGAKYLNPTETPLYNKSKVLYGLNWAKQDAVNAGEVIVCEGYTDAIGFHTAGVPRAVATCGTAMTEDHVKTLVRYAKRIVLAFDADGAGQRAADKFHEWEHRYDLDVAVVAMPDGTDPGSLAHVDPEALRVAVANATPYLAFRLERVLGGGALTTPEGRARAAEQATAIISAHPDSLVRDQYLLEVAARCRIDESVLRRLLADVLSARSRGVLPEAVSGRGSSAPRRNERSQRADGPGGNVAVERSRHRSRPGEPGGDGEGPPLALYDGDVNDGPSVLSIPVPLLEREALMLITRDPSLIDEWFDHALFSHPIVRAAILAMGETKSVREATSLADDRVASLLRQVASDEADADPEEVFVRLAQEAVRREINRTAADARMADDPLAMAPVTARLGDLHNTLIDDSQTAEVKREAGIDLLTWLMAKPEGEG